MTVVRKQQAWRPKIPEDNVSSYKCCIHCTKSEPVAVAVTSCYNTHTLLSYNGTAVITPYYSIVNWKLKQRLLVPCYNINCHEHPML